MGINEPLNRKLRMGLVGGGQGSFIGRVHTIAACLDNRAVVTAGALCPAIRSEPRRRHPITTFPMIRERTAVTKRCWTRKVKAA